MLSVSIFLIWILLLFQRGRQELHRTMPNYHLPLFPWHVDSPLWAVVMTTLFLSQTLPQSLILWFEPDMEEPKERRTI